MTLSILVMELCLVTLLAGWLWVVMAGSPWPPPWPILLSAPLALLGGRFMPYAWRRVSWFDAAWWGTVAVVVAVLAEIGDELAAGVSSGARWNLLFLAGLVLAWRGWSLAEGWIDRDLVEAELQVGTLVVLVALLILVWISPGAGLVPAVGFLTAGLVGLGLARRTERRAPKAGLESDWLMLVGAMIALVVIVAVGVVALVTPDVLVGMVEQARIVASAAISGIGALVHWLSSFLPGFGAPPEAVQPPGAPPGAMLPRDAAPRGELPLPPYSVLEALVVFVLIVFLFFLGRMLYRLMRTKIGSIDLALPRQREPAPAVSEAEPFSWRSWWRLVLAWLRGRWAAGGAPSRVADRRARSEAAQPGEQRSIRALYREFLAAVGRAGVERTPATTPAELAQSVRESRPTAASAVGALTELYVRARYGQEAVSRDELARMRTAVEQARRELTPPPPPRAEPKTELDPTPVGPGQRPYRRNRWGEED